MADVIEFASAPIDPPVKPEGQRFVLFPASLRLDRRVSGTPGQVNPARPVSAAEPRKPLLFIHNLKSHRKTGE